MSVKKTITGIAKTTGKYTLKGIGKGVELTARVGLKTVDALIRDPAIQKIATTALMIGACVTCPSIAVLGISGIALKRMINNQLLGRKGSIMDDISSIINTGTKVTSAASRNILSPVLKSVEKGVQRTWNEVSDGNGYFI